MGQYGQLGKVVDLFNGKKNGFLADHNSSIGDLVTHRVTHSLRVLLLLTLQSDPRDL